MKVIYPIYSFFPSQTGGPSNSVYWLTRALKSNGVQCIVSTTNKGISEDHNIPLNRWIDTQYAQVRYQKTAFAHFPVFALVHTILKIKDVDLIHFSSIFYPLTWLTIIFNRILWNKKIIISPRGELDPNALIYSPIRKKIVLFLIKHFLLKHVTFHATCEEEGIYTKSIFGQNVPVKVIPNLMPLTPNKRNIKEKYILYLGRIHPKKAIDNLIQSIPLATSFQDLRYKLLIVGKGEVNYEQQLKNQVSELKLEKQIEFLGHIEGEKKEEILSKARVLIMPSHTENFGNVVIEALQYNTPVIASKGTPWKILEDYHAGYWSNNDKESLAHALDQIITMDEEKYNEMCLNARQLVEDKYDVEKNINLWIEAYNQILTD